MRCKLLTLLLLCSVVAFAKVNESEFKAVVHIAASHSNSEVRGSIPIQNTYTHEVYGHTAIRRHFLTVTATIDGKSYELQSTHSQRGILDPGDYRAKYSEHGRRRYYELLTADGKAIKFEVVGTVE